MEGGRCLSGLCVANPGQLLSRAAGGTQAVHSTTHSAPARATYSSTQALRFSLFSRSFFVVALMNMSIRAIECLDKVGEEDPRRQGPQLVVIRNMHQGLVLVGLSGFRLAHEEVSLLKGSHQAGVD